jgi:L-ascorbate metabolism protein UlaG (beta-lactamase superfamily)
MHIVLIISGLLGISVFLVLQHPSFGRRMSAERRQRIESSPNYRDGKFRNEHPTAQFTGKKSAMETLWGFLTDQSRNRIPTTPVPSEKHDLRQLPAEDLYVWFGHSSYLVQVAGCRVLVDPVLRMEFPASLMLKPFKGSDIYQPEDIPNVDYLIITHEHWDHLDYATLRDLRSKIGKVICPLGVGEYIEYWGFAPDSIIEMDWYQAWSANDDSLRITCLPSRHFSNRLLKRDQTLWASFMLECGGRKVYIGGDGGYDDRFRRIHEKFANIDIAFLENGQYNEDWAQIHTTPQTLAQAMVDIAADNIVTVHHNKFALARHPWNEPDSLAREIAGEKNINLLDSPLGAVVKF